MPQASREQFLTMLPVQNMTNEQTLEILLKKRGGEWQRAGRFEVCSCETSIA